MTENVEFKYERSFFVKDLLRVTEIFKDTDTIEFASFSDFFKWYVDKQLFIDCSIERLIIPVDKPEELTLFKKLAFESMPFTWLYLRNISSDIINLLEPCLKNVAVMIDDFNVKLFKEALKKATVEAINYLKFTAGSYRINIGTEDIDSIVYKITDPFYTMPFFSNAEIHWDFENLEKEITIDRLHAISWHIKFLNINVLKRTTSSKVFWKDFTNGVSSDYSKYNLKIRKAKNSKYFYIKNDRAYFSNKESVLPSFSLEDYVNKDGNEVNVKAISDIRSIVDCNTGYLYFSSYEQNFRCNKSIAQESYLCKMLNNLLIKGDVL